MVKLASKPAPAPADPKSIPATVKRIWDDLRTVADNLGPFSHPERGGDWREFYAMAEAIDDCQGRLFKVAERVKEGA